MIGVLRAAGQVVGRPPLGLTAERLGVRAALLGLAAITVPAVVFLVAAGRTRRMTGSVR